MPVKVQQFNCQPQSLVRVDFVLLAKGFQKRRLRDLHRSGQAAIDEGDQAMMLCEPKQSVPVDAMTEDLLYASRTVPARIFATARQDQVEFWAESAGV